ncbi:MAG: RNA polymerase factor sigma-54 [Bacteroidales bacterium]|nr:RNA polymerase factor sigma-54 [Bacteroidales bacterium]
MQTQKQVLKQLQKLSPQQIQMIKLLEIPALEMEQRIKKELEINEALEEGKEEDPQTDQEEPEQEKEEDSKEDEFDFEDYLNSEDDIPEYRLHTPRDKNEEIREMPIAVGHSFKEELETQLQVNFKLSDRQASIAHYIVGNLDDDGYLRRAISQITDDLAFKQGVTVTDEEVKDTLKFVQQLDPPGIGARSLQECLLLQLKVKETTPKILLAKTIVKKYFDELTKKHYTKIQKKADITLDDLKAAIKVIEGLNPKPGLGLNEVAGKNFNVIIPDFILNIIDNQKIEIQLNDKYRSDLRVNNTYQSMLRNFSDRKDNLTKKDKETINYVKQKIDSARWFIDALNQRQITLLKTMKAIADYQKDFFLTEDEKQMKPMILKDIAEVTNLDMSTISRVVNSKYVETPFGIFLLKHFFSEKMKNSQGEDVSTTRIKEILKEIIGKENKSKPYTDEELAAVLKNHGLNVARRTVAKYREQLGIAVGRLRKEI